jgi:3-methyl-2-oxobutanoate hydroxymethyltransferase
MKANRVTPQTLTAMKRDGQRIAALTAYDYTSAQMVDAAEVPFILVGDTLGMVIQGEQTTLPVTLDHIIYHARLVARGAARSLVVGDMPFMSYHVSMEETMRNAGRLMQEAGVGGVKLEGGSEIAGTVERLVQAGVPVCGHLGYTPQSTHTLGGARIQGRDTDSALALIADAEALEAAGAFAVVLELVPTSVAEEVSRRLTIPTIGIGSGPECDGEIQVFHDVFGFYTDFKPRHPRRYLNAAEQIVAAAQAYRQDVAERTFPGPEQSSDLKPEVKRQLQKRLHGPRGTPRAAHG